MERENWEIEVLVGLAAILAAVCIGFNLFFVPDVSPSVVEVATDVQDVSSAYNGKIHLNTASESALQELDGIGPALAKRIVEYRETHGKFNSIEDLKNVRGIGDQLFDQIRDQIDLL